MFRVIPIAATLILLSATACRAESRSNIETRLRHQNGLVSHGSPTWSLQAELKLREKIADLPPLKERILRIQCQLDDHIQTNRQVWDVGRVQLESLQRSASMLQTDDGRRSILERRIKQLKSGLIEPRLLGASPTVRTQLIELSTHRTSMFLQTRSILRQIPLVKKQYERLRDDPQVNSDLKKLGDKQRIAPLKADYRADVRRIKELSLVALTDWCPIYLQSGRVRVSAVINESQPVTFTWDRSNDPTRLTSAMAEAAGIDIPRDAEHITLRLGKRSLQARRVNVPRIRFGCIVLNDVSVDILEADGEDLGARIGPGAFGEHSPRCRPARLRLSIR